MESTIFTINPDGLAWFIINRPEKRNAIDYEVMNQLEIAIDVAYKSNQCKAFIITGSGDKAFCSGGDLTLFHSLHTKVEAYPMLAKMGEILYSLLTFPKPTVALLNGVAIGGGCEIASACDFRLAKKNSKMGFVQGTLAITTGWGGASMLFEKLSYPSALQMLMSAKLYDSSEAYRLGFIDKILENENIIEQCQEFLKPFSSQYLQVLSAYKSVLIRKWDNTHMKERMLTEIEQCSLLWESMEHHVAVAKFLKK